MGGKSGYLWNTEDWMFDLGITLGVTGNKWA